MDLYSQYIRVVMVSAICFCMGAVLIEFASTRFFTRVGRATILVAMATLACFGYYAANKAQQAMQLLSAEERERVVPIVTPIREPATKIAAADSGNDYEITLKNGSTISWSLNDGALSGIHRRSRTVNTDRGSGGTRFTGGAFAGANELRNGAHDADDAVWIRSEQTNGNQAF